MVGSSATKRAPPLGLPGVDGVWAPRRNKNKTCQRRMNSIESTAPILGEEIGTTGLFYL